MRDLARRIVALRFPARWLLPILLLLPAVGLLTLLALRGAELPPGTPLSAVGVLITLPVLLLAALPEEIGWRAFALERMQRSLTPLAASLRLGLLWGFWHLPLFFLDGTAQAAIPLWQYLLQMVVLSVLTTWIFNGTGGSLIAVTLFHAVGNATSALLPPTFALASGRWVAFGLLLIVALVVLRRGGLHPSTVPTPQGASR